MRTSKIWCLVNLAWVVAVAALVGCGGGGSETDSNADPGPSVTAPTVPGAALVVGPKGTPLVGQSYSGKVVALPNDSRNRITAYRISNATVGGATPSIDTAGVISWVPNELDFQNTRNLRITAEMATGPVEVFEVSVDVRKERTVLQAALPAAAGTLADPKGRYLVRVQPEVAGSPMTGALSIVETYSADGSFRFSIRVPATSNAVPSVLDAPAPQRIARRSTTQARALSSSGKPDSGRVRQAAVDAAPGMQADIGAKLGGPFLSGQHGLLASEGEAEVFTTRQTPFYYFTRSAVGLRSLESPEASEVFQVDGTCTAATECSGTRSPVILVHGYTQRLAPWSAGLGGGRGTWGELAGNLKANGHEVFELRWTSYMRFEEAAGVLATLGQRVAEVTGKRAMIVAHSFGGIVAHLAASGRGIRFDGTAWYEVPVPSVFARIVTLGSPLSGIHPNGAGTPVNLPAGTDRDDHLIGSCFAVTCFQAGSDDGWQDEREELIAKIIAIDATRRGLPDIKAGATIRAMHGAWRSGSLHTVPFSTVVSVSRRPSEYQNPPSTDIAYKFGDGLISLIGQAVEPYDFSDAPYMSGSLLRLSETRLRRDGSSTAFMTLLEESRPSNMLNLTVNGRGYYFAIRAAHTGAQDNLDLRYPQYPIVQFPSDGQVDLGQQAAPEDHPLKHFIDSPSQLAALPMGYSRSWSVPVSLVEGRTLNFVGLAAGSEEISLQIENASTGAVVTDRVRLETNASSGTFVYNAGRALAERFPGTTLNVADFRVVVRAGDGAGFSRVLVRQPLSAYTNLGDLWVWRADEQPASMVGTVIDGQTLGSPISEVDLYIMKGLDQAENLVRQVTNTSTSRRVRTDLYGRFAVSGLDPGDYTIVAERSGYFTQAQGAVRLYSNASSAVSFSLLRVLPQGEGAITLRWRAASAGPNVSGDLDSHLKKFDSLGSLAYHIYFGNRYGSATDGLDRDDTNFEGPETITLRPDASRYVYYVHRWSFAGTLGASRPTVILRIGGTDREFALPAGEISTARYWKVFEMVGGVITPCATGCMSDIEPN